MCFPPFLTATSKFTGQTKNGKIPEIWAKYANTTKAIKIVGGDFTENVLLCVFFLTGTLKFRAKKKKKIEKFRDMSKICLYTKFVQNSWRRF